MSGPLRRTAASTIAFLAAMCAQSAVATVSAVDDRGVEIVLEHPAERIISLAPHLTENLFAIGAGDLLLGVASYSDYPPAAREIEVVGSDKDFDIERIIELEPDVVFGWISGNPAEPIERMRSTGLPLFMTEPREPADVARELTRLGELTGRADRAAKVSAEFMARIDALRVRYADRPRVPVFYEVWHDPLITLSGDHLVSKLILGCGGYNVFSGLDTLAPRISVEAVLERDPEAIITAGVKDERAPSLDEWKRFEFLLATRRGNLFYIDPDLVHRHTTRLADGMAALCELIETARRRRTP